MSDKPIPDSRMGGLFSKKKNPGFMSHESGVVNNESPNQDSGVETHEPRVITHESGVMSQESLLMEHESGIDPRTLDFAVALGCKDPRISAYSPLVMSMLRYLRKTIPEFSMSEEASSLLEDAIREKYPELSDQVEKALAKR
jgi:hypothetical protein